MVLLWPAPGPAHGGDDAAGNFLVWGHTSGQCHTGTGGQHHCRKQDTQGFTRPETSGSNDLQEGSIGAVGTGGGCGAQLGKRRPSRALMGFAVAICEVDEAIRAQERHGLCHRVTSVS